MTLETVEVTCGDDPKYCVVWLHGLGADGHDFQPMVPELKLDSSIQFVFPHAPIRPVTINNCMEMRAWYDIDLNNPSKGDQDIQASAHAVEELIKEQHHRGFGREQVVVAGFSQGGVIALQIGTRSEHSFAGILALSTYVHDHENLAEHVSFASVDTPILMAHGVMDPMIPMARAVTSRNALTGLNYQVEWHQYPMGHELCYQEILDISRFLNRVFS